MNSRSAAFVVLLCALMWSTTGTVAAMFDGNVPPAVIGAATMGIGGLLMLAVFARRAFILACVRGARLWIVAGGVAIAAYAPAFYMSMNLAGVAVGTALNIGSAPLFAALLERVIERRTLSLRWLAGISLATIGLVTLLLCGAQEPRGASRPVADVVSGGLLGVLAGFLFAFYTFATRRALRVHDDPRGVMASMFGLGGILLLPALVTLGAPLVSSTSAFLLTTFQVLVPGFAAWLLFGFALRHVTGRTATTMTLLEPVAAAGWAQLLVGQRLPTLGWVAVGVVTLGVIVATLPRRSGTATGQIELPVRAGA